MDRHRRTGAALTRHGFAGEPVLTARQAQAVAELARTGLPTGTARPQDIEWAIDHDGTAVAAAGPADDRPARTGVVDAAGAGVVDAQLPPRRVAARGRSPHCSRSWLLPVLEDGYLDGMHASVGVRVRFRYAVVNGWYYNAPPIPSPKTVRPSAVAGPRPSGQDHRTMP